MSAMEVVPYFRGCWHHSSSPWDWQFLYFVIINGFADSSVTWIATFITVVGAPPAVMLLYGPSVPALLTSSIIGGLICAPTAIWIGDAIVTPWNFRES